MRIGVFDSGLGGLTILKAILAKSPQYDYVYLGDNARVPYGDKTKETIYKYTKQAIDFLASGNCSLIIFACNTASSTALRKIQREYLPKRYPNIKVLGVIRPTVEALNQANLHRVGVIGTQSTIKSRSFIREIRKFNPKLKVCQQATPLLVPFIEEGETKLIDVVLKKYLLPLKRKGVDSLILGCTHYEHLMNKIKKIMGRNIKVIGESRIVANKLANYLNRHPEIEQNLTKNELREYFFTNLESVRKLPVPFSSLVIKLARLKI